MQAQVVGQETLFVCSSAEVAKAAQHIIKSIGLDLAATRSTRDLGVDAAGGGRRAVKVTKGRLRKAESRAARIRTLSSKVPVAIKLVPTGLLPAMMHGDQVIGVFPGPYG